MRLAAIDIGSNSIHMIIARIDGDGNIKVIDRIKDMARLGEETLSTGYLSEEAQERGLTVLRQYKALADAHQVDDILAVATSATREARNGAEFIERVRESCDIPARIIDGVEEGHYIYLGAREVYDFGNRRALLVDIGGGSVEFIVADRRRPFLIKSLRLGVRRLKDRFMGTVPPPPEEVEELTLHVRNRLESIARAVRKRGFEHVVATSGTALTLARLVFAHAGIPMPSESVFVPLPLFEDYIQHLLRLDAQARQAIEGVDDRRRDTLLHGALLLRTTLEFFGAEGFTTCDGALREGLIVDYLEQNRSGVMLREEVPDPRRRSVLILSRRLIDTPGHCQHVARLALRLFDDLQSLHRLSMVERELLDFASLLHSCGQIVSRSGHHKHALYILRNAELTGFTPRERNIVANVARYHRRGAPKARHLEFMELEPRDREIVKKLSALLRIANALDRGRQGNVAHLEARLVEGRVEVQVRAHTDIGLEINKVREQEPYFEATFGWPIRVMSARLQPLDPDPAEDDENAS